MVLGLTGNVVMNGIHAATPHGQPRGAIHRNRGIFSRATVYGMHAQGVPIPEKRGAVYARRLRPSASTAGSYDMHSHNVPCYTKCGAVYARSVRPCVAALNTTQVGAMYARSLMSYTSVLSATRCHSIGTVAQQSSDSDPQSHQEKTATGTETGDLKVYQYVHSLHKQHKSSKAILVEALQSLVGSPEVQTSYTDLMDGWWSAVIKLPPSLHAMFPSNTEFWAWALGKRGADAAASYLVLLTLEAAGVLPRQQAIELNALRERQIATEVPGRESSGAALFRLDAPSWYIPEVVADFNEQAVNAFKGTAQANETTASQLQMSPKQLLFEILQPEMPPDARLTECVQSMPYEGDLFKAEVSLPDSLLKQLGTNSQAQFLGVQRSKRDAEHEAALAALTALGAAGMLSSQQKTALAGLAPYPTGAEVSTHFVPAPSAADVDARHLPSENRMRMLQEAMQYNFSDTELLRRACHHPSIVGLESNDRLAMLGDSVLNVVVLQEGMDQRACGQIDDKLMLSKHKVDRVSRLACARHARKLGLDQAVVMGSCHVNIDGSRTAPDSALAEAFEAIVGAIFLDAGGNNGGLTAVTKFWRRLDALV